MIAYIILSAFAVQAMGASMMNMTSPMTNMTSPMMNATMGNCSIKTMERVAVANRGNGSVSIIDAVNKTVLRTVILPAKAEPMYISVVDDDMWVGDRGNDAIHVYGLADMMLKKTIATGAGVFHSMATQTNSSVTPRKNTQVWVNNDINKTTTVISASNYSVLAQVPTPADLAAMGGKPHDVTVGSDMAWVTYLGFNDTKTGYVVAFSTKTFKEVARAMVGGDPHVAQRPTTPLYVPCQATSSIFVLDRKTLKTLKTLKVPNAHGAYVPTNGNYFYTTNIAGAGKQALWALKITRPSKYLLTAGMAVDTTVANPHNVVVNDDGSMAFITHSGPNSTAVSVIMLQNGMPSAYYGQPTVLTTGLNPFGITYYKQKMC